METGAPGVAARGRHHANSFSKQLNTISDGNEVKDYGIGMDRGLQADEPNQVSTFEFFALLYLARHNGKKEGKSVNR